MSQSEQKCGRDTGRHHFSSACDRVYDEMYDYLDVCIDTGRNRFMLGGYLYSIDRKPAPYNVRGYVYTYGEVDYGSHVLILDRSHLITLADILYAYNKTI